jgi:hypothetical protein
MLFQRINRSDPEKVFIIGYNSTADAWSNGYVVRWDYSTDKDGVGLEKPAAQGAVGVGKAAIAGVVAESIASGATGLIQIWGYHSAVRVKSATGASTTTNAVNAGTMLCGCVTAYYALENSVVTGTQANAYCKGFAFDAQLLNTTTATACFIMCL